MGKERTNGALGAHTVALAGQTPRALASLRQFDTALLLHVHGGLGTRLFRFALVFLFLLLRRPSNPRRVVAGLISRLPLLTPRLVTV